jgi:hypothetical protein
LHCLALGRQETDDDLHAYWKCPRHAHSEDEAIIKSQFLIDMAVAESVTSPSLWFRGLLPSNSIKLPIDFQQQYDFRACIIDGPHIPEDRNIWPSAVYFGDASGGIYSEFPTIRRVGVGIAAYSSEQGHPLFSMYCPLESKVQTVPRGETNVLTVITGKLAHGSVATIYTYNLPVYNTFNQG